MEDIIRRAIKRELPCKLTDEERLRIADERSAKEAERDKLKAEAKLDAERRKAQIADLEDEIAKKGLEVYTRHQDRTVICDEFFRRDLEGSGWVHTIRRDTGEEVERRPATVHEMQRHLPGTETSPAGGLLEEARARQSDGALLDQIDATAKKGRGRKSKSDEPSEEPSDVPGDQP